MTPATSPDCWPRFSALENDHDRDPSTTSLRTPRSASLWRNRDFLLLWGGQIVSSIGTQVSQLALPLLILALTHSPAQAGLLAAIRGLPYLLLVLPAGALVDRWDPRRVMLICDTGRALALASVPIALALGHLSLTQLYVVSLLEGMLFVFFDQANSNCFVRVVAKDDLPAAVAQNQAIYGTSALVGPALGGLLFGLGRGVPFLADAVSYAVSVAAVFAIHSRCPAPGPRLGDDAEPERGDRRRAALAAWSRRHPLYRRADGRADAVQRRLFADFDRAGAAVSRRPCRHRPAAGDGRAGHLCRFAAGRPAAKAVPVRPADDRRDLGMGHDRGFCTPWRRISSGWAWSMP